MIDLYILCFNEEKILQFVIDHHKKNFPNGNIIFYDNMSTDNSEKIMKQNGCQVRKFDTGHTFNDQVHMDIKNSCWKEESKNDWVLIADLDELPHVTEDQLKQETANKTSVLTFEGYTLIGGRTGCDLVNLKTGVRDGGHDKRHIFNRRMITDMNYGPGAHTANPTGIVKYSSAKYKTVHYKWISLEYITDRHHFYAARMSHLNKQRGWGIQYYWTDAKLTEIYDGLITRLSVVL